MPRLAILLLLPLLWVPAAAGAEASLRVSVTGFENKVKGVFGNWKLGEGLAEILTTELLADGRYLVVERAALTEVLAEQALGQSGLARAESAPQAGQLVAARIIFRGAVTEFSDAASGYGGNVGVGVGSGDLSVSGKSKSAHVAIDLRAIDAQSGQILASRHVSKEAPSVGGQIDYSHSDFQIGGGAFNRTPLGKAARAAIAEAVAALSPRLARLVPAPGLKVIKAQGNLVYVNGGTNRGLRRGWRYRVKAEGEVLIDPDTGLALGSLDEERGVVEIVTVKEKFAIAETVSGGGFQRGDLLEPQ